MNLKYVECPHCLEVNSNVFSETELSSCMFIMGMIDFMKERNNGIAPHYLRYTRRCDKCGRIIPITDKSQIIEKEG